MRKLNKQEQKLMHDALQASTETVDEGSMTTSPTGYLADSSFNARPRGGRKYHLMGSDGCGSKCGLPILIEETRRDWNTAHDAVKCKRCAKAR